ncbi:uncharacterized protein LOC128952753 [Oppia nitens]|uniref:uncharacterized protein LOC128952753 n=1 Tax=Oppia nitens TaxID=1686743 RepID=UPI0023D9CDE5|nr:uncharacterized protein LOC128952753 [Oppia nitens]
MSTDCHRYLSQFVDITADTIDILVENGFTSLNTLLAIDLDKHWQYLPPQISMAQKLLLGQALGKLEAEITDDNDNNVNIEKSDNNNIDVKDSITVNCISRPFICNYDNCNKTYKRKKHLRQHMNCVHTTGQRFDCKYNECNKSFANKHSKRMHERRFHENRRQNHSMPQQQQHNVPKVETKPDIKPVFLLSWTPKSSQ